MTSSCLHVVLVEPEIPHNTGAIARLCLATGSKLHLVGRLGFRIDEKSVRRAGLDYWEHVEIATHPTFEDFRASFEGSIHLYETTGTAPYTEATFRGPSAIVFGSETRGLSAAILALGLATFHVPIYDARVRSLNLATTVGIVLYDAVRQLQTKGLWEGGTR